MTGVKGKSGGARPGSGPKPKPKPQPVVLPPTLVQVDPGKVFDPRPAMEQIAQGIIDVPPQQYKALALLMSFVHGKAAEGGKKEQKQVAAEKAATGKFGLRAVK